MTWADALPVADALVLSLDEALPEPVDPGAAIDGVGATSNREVMPSNSAKLCLLNDIKSLPNSKSHPKSTKRGFWRIGFQENFMMDRIIWVV